MDSSMIERTLDKTLGPKEENIWSLEIKNTFGGGPLSFIWRLSLGGKPSEIFAFYAFQMTCSNVNMFCCTCE